MTGGDARETTRRRDGAVRLRRGEAGYSLVALLAAVAVMMVLLGMAMPSWRYVMKNDNEEELLFRGGQIADAIARYQRRNGNALPPSLEVLVQGRYLRKAYKDPMTKHGRWRMLRPGDALLTPGAPGGSARPSQPGGASPTTTTTTTRPSAFSPPGQTIGGFQGVASTSTDTSLRLFNNRTRYNEWLFVAGQPRVVGRAPAGPQAGSAQPRGSQRPGGGAATRP
jgi:type II secretory pathway pseudopilin PulG